MHSGKGGGAPRGNRNAWKRRVDHATSMILDCRGNPTRSSAYGPPWNGISSSICAPPVPRDRPHVHIGKEPSHTPIEFGN